MGVAFFRTPPASPAYSNPSCVEQRSRVRRLHRRPTPLRGVSLYTAGFAGVHQHLVHATTIACAAASPLRGVFSTATPRACNNDRVCGGFAAGLRRFAAFFRVRRLRRRPTPLRGVFSTATPCAFNNDRVCGGLAADLRRFAAFFLYAACFAGVHQHLGHATTIACAAASPPPDAASRRFFVHRRLRRRTATPRAFNNDRVCGGFAAALRRFAAFFSTPPASPAYSSSSPC